MDDKVGEYETMIQNLIEKYETSLELLAKAKFQIDVLKYKNKKQERII